MKASSPVRGLLLDLDGVLYVGESPVMGAVGALKQLKTLGMERRFLTNTTTRTASAVVDKLNRLGFEVREEEVFTPVTATLRYLEVQGMPSVHPVVRDSVMAAFEAFPRDDRSPDHVVIGDIGAAWSYPLMNTLFRQLMAGAELIAMHRNKFFQGEEGLTLDIGAFVAGLESVTGKSATIIGKPSATFFEMALGSLGLGPGEVVMVGDDVESDVGGAQAAGLRGVLVQTGKYRAGCEEAAEVVPDAVLPSIAALPEWLGKRTDATERQS